MQVNSTVPVGQARRRGRHLPSTVESLRAREYKLELFCKLCEPAAWVARSGDHDLGVPRRGTRILVVHVSPRHGCVVVLKFNLALELPLILAYFCRNWFALCVAGSCELDSKLPLPYSCSCAKQCSYLLAPGVSSVCARTPRAPCLRDFFCTNIPVSILRCACTCSVRQTLTLLQVSRVGVAAGRAKCF